MGFLHIILPILVGGVIGYCTNYIAIKMMFHPHKAIYIGKHQLPFTPGIIPKNQKRLAGAIGDAVSEQLLTKDAVLENVGENGDQYISNLAANLCNSDMSILDMLPKEMPGEDIIGSVSTSLSRSIVDKVGQIDFDSVVRQFGQDAINSLLRSAPMLAMLLNADTQNMIYDKLGTSARDYFNEHGEEVANGFISEYIKELAKKPVGEFVSGQEEKERLQKVLESTIRNVAGKYGSDFLDQFDIKGIVTQQIEAMDVDELEDLVLSVMKHELQAVINLGAVIGCIIGIINIFL